MTKLSPKKAKAVRLDFKHFDRKSKWLIFRALLLNKAVLIPVGE